MGEIIRLESNLSHLAYLDIHALDFDEDLASHFASFISSSPIRTLSLAYVSATPHSLVTIMNGIAQSRALSSFKFDNENQDAVSDISPFAYLLSSTRTLREFSLCVFCTREMFGYEEFWSSVSTNESLLKLDVQTRLSEPTVPFPVMPVLQALDANKVLKNAIVSATSYCEPSEELFVKLKQAQYDQISLLFRGYRFKFGNSEVKKTSMILEAYRLVKFGRILASSKCSKAGFRFPVEILVRIFTRGMITEQDWVPEQLEVILRCLLKRSTYGLIADPDLDFNESSLFVVCNRALSNLARE